MRIFDGHHDWVSSVAVCPAGRHAVTGSGGGAAAVFGPGLGERLREPDGARRAMYDTRRAMYAVAMSPDGRHAIACSFGGIAAVWDLGTGKQQGEFNEHQMVLCVAVGPDGRHIVTGSDDGTAAVWDLATGERLRELAGHVGPVNTVAVGHDGRQVATGSGDQSVRVWDIWAGQPQTLVSLDGPVLCVGWSLDGRSLAAGMPTVISMLGVSRTVSPSA